jgi:hypothetical protein
MIPMIAPGEIVRFQLSQQGSAVLRGPKAFFQDEVVQARVVSVDELGVWIEYTEAEALLLKWQHFETAVVDILEEQSLPIKRIGF